MADEPKWDDIFRAPVERPVSAPERHAAAPVSGVAAAAEEARRDGLATGSITTGAASSGAAPTATDTLPPRAAVRGRNDIDERPYKPRKKRRWGLLIFLLCFLLAAGGAGYALWGMYGERVQSFLGVAEPIDYEGSGNGEKVTISILSGQIGSDVAVTLTKAGVTKTFEAFYKLLLANPDVSFVPGAFSLQKEMSAESALDALQNPANKIVNQITIPEGTAAVDAIALISAATGVSVADFEAAAADPAALGLPADAKSLEGFLFPATYQFDPGTTATQILTQLVGETVSRLRALGVADADMVRTVILASIIQRESGPNTDDMYKISRVFTNRITDGMNLESDATVAYGTGNLHTVWTTDEERDDAGNLYNTYKNPGLPVGPIGLPGETALDAAVHPADGPWLFFVPINLKTGETVFSETADQHEAAAAKLRAWCRESSENGVYCQ